MPPIGCIAGVAAGLPPVIIVADGGVMVTPNGLPVLLASIPGVPVIWPLVLGAINMPPLMLGRLLMLSAGLAPVNVPALYGKVMRVMVGIF